MPRIERYVEANQPLWKPGWLVALVGRRCNGTIEAAVTIHVWLRRGVNLGWDIAWTLSPQQHSRAAAAW